MFRDHPPDSAAIISPQGTITWAEWGRQIDEAARRLAAQAPRGGVVSFVADDPVETAGVLLGGIRAGVVVAPLSPRLPDPTVRRMLARLGAAPLDEGQADEAGLPDALRHQGGVVVHTSGTTGDPKAAFLATESLIDGARGVADHVGLAPSDSWLLDLPTHHVAGVGIVVRCALAGAAMVLRQRSPALEAPVTHVSMVDTQLHRVLQADDRRPPPSLRVALLGGGPPSPSLLDRAIDAGWPVASSYGLTEMGSTVTATRPGAGVPERYTAGRPLPGREVSVVDGEIRVRGAGLFSGYLADGDLRLALDEAGFFATGDLGFLDDDGRLVITGRADERFISGGENVQPEEIEAALMSLPGIVRAVVVPVPDAEFGRRGVAFVQMYDGSAPDASTLAAGLRDRIEDFKLPVRYIPLPASMAGRKPDRAGLRQLAIDASAG